MKYESWSLDDWVDMFERIYGERNAGIIDEILLLHLVEEVAELAEDLRKEHLLPRKDEKNRDIGVPINIADAFAWLTSLLYKRGASLVEIVWHKFPNVCPYCFVDKNCKCTSQMFIMPKKKRETLLDNVYRKNRKNMPKTLYEWEQKLYTIYGNVNKNQSMPKIGFHLMEEVGEVSKYLRLKKELKMNDEIADVFAWLTAILMRVREMLSNQDIRLDKIIWDRYKGVCDRCHKCPCKCDKEDRWEPRE